MLIKGENLIFSITDLAEEFSFFVVVFVVEYLKFFILTTYLLYKR